MQSRLLPRRRAALALGLAVAALALGCDEPSGIETPELVLEPPEFVFPRSPVGAEEVRRVTVNNQGAAELIIVDVELDDRSSGGEFTLALDEGAGPGPVPAGRLVVPPGGRIEFEVTYRVVDETNDTGTLRFSTNDPDALEVPIPIRAGDVGAEIVVNPRSLDFGDVEVGQTRTRMLTIQNLGLADLEIGELVISGREGFDVRQDGASVAGPRTPPLRVPGQGSTLLEVVYTPVGLGTANGQLDIRSNAINGGSTTVDLYANGAVPCMNVVPDTLNFGPSLLVDDREGPTPNRRALIIENCGSTPLQIDRIELDDPAGVFDLVDPPEPVEGGLLELPGAVGDEEPPSANLEVGFWPLAIEAYGGYLRIYSNVPPIDEPTVVDLFGRGVDNECPEPRVTQDLFEVQPLEIITLDGTPSSDPDGEVRKWRWTVVERPEGSVSQPLESFADPRRPADGGEADDTATPRAQFFVDLTGEYVLELQVVDALNQVSCDPRAVARVTIRAVPQKELHIQLVWSTPDDPDETDTTGTDVDLHLAHQRADGRWSGAADGWDCYFRNAQPDWGVVGEVADNPSLDIDDTNGAGPENINLAEPEIGVSYEVGAIYFRSTSTFGDPEVDRLAQHPSYVTMRIFNRGTPLAELVGKELTEGMQLWHMATVTWCEGEGCPQIDIVDELYAEGEYNLP